VASPFEILGVDPDADDAELSRAYRRRVMETHPDQGGSAREFQQVRRAYEEIRTGAGGDGVAVEPTGPRSTVDPDPDSDPDSDPGTAEAGEGGDTDPASDERTGVQVEYLNYDVLADHGWDLDDADLFEKAADADLADSDYGRIYVEPRESVLEAAEKCGFAWPYACRGCACANCAVAVTEGEMEMPAGHILSADLLDRGFELSCIGMPTTDELKIVYNVKHLPDLDELRLPASRFEQAQLND
jgi:curved DNA-binding protein CbpA